MAQIQVGLRMERELFERVNEARGSVPRNRWIVRALEATLGSSGSIREPVETSSVGGSTPASPRASVRKPAAVAQVSRGSELFRSTEAESCPGCDEPMNPRVEPRVGGPGVPLWVCPSCGTRAKRLEEALVDG